MKIYLLILCLVCTLSCGVDGEKEKANDQVNIQGVWLAQTESQNGITKNVSYQYIFRGDKVTFIDETGKEMQYTFRLNTSGNPRLLIIRPAETPNDSAAVSVAYELHGDSLKIVVAPAGLRPAEISDNNDQELIICKRKGL
ncbi:TIGR03067 domain-containing protein [Panacibacter sp. DH6]|uniref:TIGR03067 domain-containing protein n=1 Tax=Panacibacter microcysteis TaxID=2793269 RepID=A0A931EBC8_9BACT|nr:TIGR03067 domain-containing protein [Panacibacter microcysteis]MBG9377401.1 TIGR03067 domain-containing protein [Panacibacter microcysteis]